MADTAYYIGIGMAIPKKPSASLLPSASADGLKGLEAKPLPLWTLGPFHLIIFKGIKTQRGTGKARPDYNSVQKNKEGVFRRPLRYLEMDYSID